MSRTGDILYIDLTIILFHALVW